MRKQLLGLALAAAGLVGLTAQAATAAGDGTSQDLDVVVNVIDSTPPGEQPAQGGDTSGQNAGTTITDTNDPDAGVSGGAAGTDPAGTDTAGTDTADTAGTTGSLPYTGFDPRLGAFGLGALAAGGLLLWGAKRKNDGKTFLPKTALIVAGAAGLAVAGSFTAWAAEPAGTAGTVETDGDIVITIDKAEALNGQANFTVDLPGASTYFGVQGRIDAPAGITFAVDGQPLTGDLAPVMSVDNPDGTGHVNGTLTATIDPNTAVDSFHLTYTVEAVDQRYELTLNPQVEDKTYDGATAADGIVFASTSEFVDGIQDGDDVTVETVQATLEGEFASPNAGNEIGVTVDPGQFSLTGADAHKYYFTVTQPVGNITQKPVTVTGLTAQNKTYDGDTTTDVTGDGDLVGVIEPDEVDLVGDAIGQFDTKNAGEDKPVTVTGLSLTGDDAANYRLAVEPLQAGIDPKEVQAKVIRTKFYDGYSFMSPSYDQRVEVTDGLVSGDTLDVSCLPVPWYASSTAVGTYLSEGEPNGGLLQITGGSDNGGHNYVLASTFTRQDVIQPKPLTIDLTLTKVYDGDGLLHWVLNERQVTVGGLVGNDQFTVGYVFPSLWSVDANAGSHDAGSGVTGADLIASFTEGSASNYELPETFTMTAVITPKPLSVIGAVAQDRVYDGTPSVTMSDWGSLDASGIVGNDNVTLDTSEAWAYFTKGYAGNDLPVLLGGYQLEGTAAGNYKLAGAPTATASIAKRDWSATVEYTVTKAWDGNTSLSGASIVRTGHSEDGLAPVDVGGLYLILDTGSISAYPSADPGTYQGTAKGFGVYSTRYSDGTPRVNNYNSPSANVTVIMVILEPVNVGANTAPLGSVGGPVDEPVADDVVPVGDPSDPQEDVKPVADAVSAPDEAAREEDVAPDALPVGGDEGEPEPDPAGEAELEAEPAVDPAGSEPVDAGPVVEPVVEPAEAGAAADAVADAPASATDPEQN
ncbi:MAG: YDG domain-containing protein [Bifidobacteriaceae bacterium]|jgi:hypothetical protein|nr:YDG domain-containing protein [Bifidobacteriaceae bacterium]